VGPSGLALPPIRSGGFAIVVAAAIASGLLADQPLGRALVLDTAAPLATQWWTAVTANLVFPEGQLGGLLGTLVLQWMIGGALESFWGTRRYVLFTIGCGVLGHAALLAVAAALAAAGSPVPAVVVGGTLAMDVAVAVGFGVVFARTPVMLFAVLPLQGRGVGWLVAGLALAGPLLRGAPWTAVVPTAVAALAALLWTTQPWRGIGNAGKLQRRSRSARPRHLQVVRSQDLLN
jgi:membrane associated rhomboid family serine protease